MREFSKRGNPRNTIPYNLGMVFLVFLEWYFLDFRLFKGIDT